VEAAVSHGWIAAHRRRVSGKSRILRGHGTFGASPCEELVKVRIDPQNVADKAKALL